jgi:hypothetical protein
MMDGVTTIVNVAHLRLCHSRMMFVRTYPREKQEMVFDVHDRAFAFSRVPVVSVLVKGWRGPIFAGRG